MGVLQNIALVWVMLLRMWAHEFVDPCSAKQSQHS